jgi:hypothetical protein
MRNRLCIGRCEKEEQMKKRLWILPLALIAVAALFTTGCEEMWAEQDGVVRTSYLRCGDPDTFDIIAGQHYDAGDILVWNCTSYVIVKITTHDPWTMTESQLAWADDCADLPRNKRGKLVPGRFPYNTTHDPAVTEYTYMIPMGDWEPGDTVALAFHCVVWMDSINEETGWGGEWKGCFKFVIKECFKDVSLPTYPIRMRGFHPGPNSYWRVELDGINETGYNVWNGTDWRGWCSERLVTMYPNRWYTVTLLSSQDPGMPDRVKYGTYRGLRRWDCVNWFLNNMPTLTVNQKQSVIWYLVGELHYKPSGAVGDAIDDALLYGNGFRPETGDWIAVITLTPRNVQLCFIEVDP